MRSFVETIVICAISLAITVVAVALIIRTVIKVM
jgi:hypothetical protein